MRHKTIKVDVFDFVISVLQAQWKICGPKDGLRILSRIRGFAWLITRVLNLMIKFIGPLYKWLQQFTNHYLTHCHLLRLDTHTSLLQCIPLYSFNSYLIYDWLHSHLSVLLYSVSGSTETPAEHPYPRKRRLGFQESISTETCLSTRSLAMGLRVTIL
jgi:hypothetical protein